MLFMNLQRKYFWGILNGKVFDYFFLILISQFASIDIVIWYYLTVLLYFTFVGC